jgi:hypothetical protein
MNNLQFAGRYQCLPIRCSVRLISLQKEHPICPTAQTNVSCSVIKQIDLSNGTKFMHAFILRLKHRWENRGSQFACGPFEMFVLLAEIYGQLFDPPFFFFEWIQYKKYTSLKARIGILVPSNPRLSAAP